MQSGKSTVAAALAEKYGFIHLSFATPLKEDVVGMGFDREDVYNRKPLPIRELLQKYGQARRYQDGSYWLKRLEHSVHMRKPTSIFIIDDVRFENEAQWVEEQGVLIRLERLGHVCPDQDTSEIALDNFRFEHVVHGDEGPTSVIDLIEHVEDVLWAEGVIE